MGGTEGTYRVRYEIEDPAAKLRRNEQEFKVHEQRVSGGARGTIDVKRTDSRTRAQNAQTRALRESRLELERQARTSRGAQAQADKHAIAMARNNEIQERTRIATERLRMAQARHTAGMVRSQSALHLWGMALRRMLLWWGTAALLLGTQKIVRSTLEIAGAFQMVVKRLNVLGSEGEAVYQKLAMAGYQAAAMTGRSFSEAAAAMEGWVRQGYSASEVADLTRTVLMGLNLTQMSSADLTKTLTALLRAYNIPASESVGILDKLVGVSRRFAIEASELAIGVRRFASSARVANLTLSQTLSVMTAMMVKTQQSASMVGRAGRQITTRMRRNAVDALETIAKVKVFTDETKQSYRSLWDVLSDLSVVWTDLTERQREEIAFQAAGMRQREFFLALMSSWNTAVKANIEALASSGLAMRSNIILVETYQKAVQGLRTEWERFLAMQSGLLSYFTNMVYGLREMLRVLGALPEAVYALGAALAALAGGGIAMAGHPVIGGIMAAGGVISGITYLIGKMRIPNVQDIIEEYKMLIESQYQAAKSTEELAKEFVKLHDAQSKGVDNTENLKLARDRLNELNPGLLGGEEDLAKAYEILKGKLADVSVATREAYEARRLYLEQEKRAEISEAHTQIYEAQRALPLEMRGMKDAELAKEANRILEERIELMSDVRTLEAARVETLRSLSKLTAGVPLATEITRQDIRNLAQNQEIVEEILTLNDKIVKLRTVQEKIKLSEELSAEEQAYMGQYKTVLTVFDTERQRTATVNQLGIILGTLTREMTAQQELLSMREDAYTADIFSLRRQINASRDLAAALRTVVDSEARLTILNKELAALMKDTGDAASDMGDKIVADEEQIREEASKITAELNARRLAWEREYILIHGLVDKEHERTQLAVHLYASAVKYLAQQAKTTDDINRRTALMRELEKYAKGSEKSEQLQLDIAKSRLTIIERGKTYLDRLLDRDRKAHQESQRNLERIQRLELQGFKEQFSRIDELMSMKTAAAEAELEQIQRLESERLQLTEGAVAAAEYEYNAAKRRFDFMAAEARTAEERMLTEEAYLKLLDKETALQLAIMSEEHDIGQERLRRIETQFDTQVALTRLREGEVAAAEMVLKKREEEFAVMQFELGLGKTSLALEEKKGEIAEAQGNLRLARVQKEIDLAKSYDDLLEQARDAEKQRLYETLGLQRGRAAALRVELSDMEQELDMLILMQRSQEDLLEIEKMRFDIEQKRRDLVEKESKSWLDQSAVQRGITGFIDFAAGQIAAVMSESFTKGGFAGGLGGWISSLLVESHPYIAAAVAGLTVILETALADNTEATEESTIALRRLDQTLKDVDESLIAVATTFRMPSGLTYFGELPEYQGGGRVPATGPAILHKKEYVVPAGGTFGETHYHYDMTANISVSGVDKDADRLADEIIDRLDREFGVESRRGWSRNRYSLE